METNDFNINLNQNLWGLLLALIALGTAEYFCLCALFWFGLILSGLTSISFLVTLTAYTIKYWKNKMKSI